MADIKKGTKIGPYKIVEILPGGKGGMARVVRAQAEDSETDVALKISRADHGDPRFNNALKQEVDILKPLQHPGVVQVLNLPLANARQDTYMARAIELPGKPWFYAMEFLPGGSLLGLTNRIGLLPFPVTCTIASLVVDALAFLRQHGIAHLDVKPENLLFRFPPVKESSIAPVLIDFGIAARTKSPRTSGGSVHTMAPEHLEQARGVTPPEVPLDLGKMDIYSLGVVTYRMWTGKYPFEGIDSGSITNKVINSQVQPPGELNPVIPADANSFMLRWLSKNPAERPAHTELKRYLDYWSDGEDNFPDLPRRKHRKKFWILW